MKLYAICLVKNEDDVIGQTLSYATKHCDKIFVIDNGSTDNTWAIAQSLAREHDRIVPFVQTHEPYSNGLRAKVYNQLREEMSDDDWWLILDADEFLAEDPRPLMRAAAASGADIIRAWQIQFYFTDIDHQEWQKAKEDRNAPIYERRKYYLINWQEPRLFRHRKGHFWDVRKSDTVPDGLTSVYRRRILNRHYQYRDPDQIEKRLRNRYGHPTSFRYVKSLDWQTQIRPASGLSHYADGKPWEFKLAGLLYYYRRQIEDTIVGKFHGAVRRLRRAAFPN